MALVITVLSRKPLCLLVGTIVLLSSCMPASPSPAPPPLVSGNSTDHLALLSFKSLITVDPHGFFDSWNETFHFCRWRGVTCGGRRHPQRVTALDLERLDLVGSISPSLANLTFLRRLHFPENHFRGRIPPEIGRLSRLRHLNLSTNSLGGAIPANLSRCSNLLTINLRKNMFVGRIPGELASLPKLDFLNLGVNNLKGGIPPSLGNSSLSMLILMENNLEGSIPAELGKISSLQVLALGQNNLSGRIPPSVYNLSSLWVLHLGTNRLSGALPPDIGGSLPRLRTLSLYHNQFEGRIPSSLANASGLGDLQLANNSFSGVIPSNLGTLQGLFRLSLFGNHLEAEEASDWGFLTSLTNCSHLKRLSMHGNELRGTLPMSVANLTTELEWLTIGENHVSGSIPTGIGNLVNLTVLYMNQNLLTGTIPDTVGNLQSLRRLTFSDNKLSGEIPSSLGDLTELTTLSLDVNELRGSIPASLKNCRNLELLDLSYNRLSGAIPEEVVSLSSLSIYLDLSHNSLVGSLPSEVGNLKNLGGFNISENRLSGPIPSSLGECQVMEYLRMEGNSFRGIIPSSLSNLRGVRVMDLSRNNLSGPIPEFLETFQLLENLNLSFNNFEGEVRRKGVFGNLSKISVSGNKKLCGGIPNLHLQECILQAKRRRHGSWKLKVIIIVVILVPCLMILFCLFAKYCWIKKSMKKSLSMASLSDQFAKISHGELFKATNGFSVVNLLGVGSFGAVYKGILGHDEKVVAVKVLNLQQQGASKSFITECEALRNIRHRNLVKIVTSCSNVDYTGNDFKALVFEFMTNGSLEKWLHPDAFDENDQLEYLNLTQTQRLNIAVDVASALDYLHHRGQKPIAHCDLKPTNILLDNDMTAHVGDFGLTRFLSTNASKSSKDPTSSIGIKGSVGYIAPEYGMGSQVSTSGDVYSYGILLLEMFTGKRPTEATFGEGLNLHQYVQMAFPEQVMNIIDPRLLSQEEDGEANNNIQNIYSERERLQNCLISVIKIGLLCSKESPRERMEMGDVVKEIHMIRDTFLGVGIHG